MITTPCILASKVTSIGRSTSWSENYRKAWIDVHGPIPDGYELHHKCCELDETCPGGNTCKHRGCRNVEHLELVTRSENLKKGKRNPNQRTFKDAWNSWTDEQKQAHREKGRANAAKRWNK